MNDIENRLDKFLIKENTVNEYDEWTDIENDAIESMKEFAKLFSGRYTGDGVTLYPYKKRDEWEVYAVLNDTDPVEYDVTVSLYSGDIGMDGSLSFITDELTDKMIKEIGRLQKAYYDAVLYVTNGLGKLGDLEI